jgi:hypothetical protein
MVKLQPTIVKAGKMLDIGTLSYALADNGRKGAGAWRKQC